MEIKFTDGLNSKTGVRKERVSILEETNKNYPI